VEIVGLRVDRRRRAHRSDITISDLRTACVIREMVSTAWIAGCTIEPVMDDTPITTIEAAVERIYDLNVGTIGTGAQRHERPHKPTLVLAALDLIAKGSATAEKIQWSDELRTIFRQYFEKIHRLNDSDTPENPFVYLRSDGFWNPVVIGDTAIVPLDHPPTVSEAREGKVYASFSQGMQLFVQDAPHRARLREAIVSRYFPMARSAVEPLFQEPTEESSAAEQKAMLEETSEVGPGRNSLCRNHRHAVR
jgi:predicted restriction endonuclease